MFNMDYAKARTLQTPPMNEFVLCQVGCGGTGSWLAPTTARVARILREERGMKVHLIYCDPDIVEPGNIFRQHFADAEIGRNKAECIAARYAQAWGGETQAWPVPFDMPMLDMWGMKVVIGCVDNASARRSMHKVLDMSPGTRWWLDCGNSYSSGQVLIGNAIHPDQLWDAWKVDQRCLGIPNPGWQRPELLVDKPEELADANLSCDVIAMRNLQSLTVNQMVAAIAGDYLVRLLLTHTLQAFATYFDLAAGAVRSEYLTPEAVGRYIDPKARPAVLPGHKRGKGRHHHGR